WRRSPVGMPAEKLYNTGRAAQDSRVVEPVEIDTNMRASRVPVAVKVDRSVGRRNNTIQAEPCARLERVEKSDISGPRSQTRNLVEAEVWGHVAFVQRTGSVAARGQGLSRVVQPGAVSPSRVTKRSRGAVGIGCASPHVG